MMILGYRAVYDESEITDAHPKYKRRTGLEAQARRWKFVMRLLGDHEAEKYDPKFPKVGDPPISQPTDYQYNRAGSRGERFDSNLGDNYQEGF